MSERDGSTAKLSGIDSVIASKAAIVARRARAAVKADVAIGARTPLDVLCAANEDATSAEGRLRVTEFLNSIPAVGPKKTARILTDLEISSVKRLGGLGKFQRSRLRGFLRAWAATRGGSGHRLVVLAGPTAVGKGTVAEYIRVNYPEMTHSVSATTRLPRPGEIDGTTYHFISHDDFERMIAEDQFLEWATVHNMNRYGTPRGPVEEALAAGKSVLLEIDLQGARQVRKAMPDATFVFLMPPSWGELVRRLVGRGTESVEEQGRRLATARVELAAVDEFDVVVVNDTVPHAAERIVQLLR